MKCYWWDEFDNFGDLLGPALLQHFGVRSEHAEPAEADLVCIGSVLGHLPDGWRGTVAGAGLLDSGHVPDLSGARIRAVRGPLTASALGLSVPVCADPGLLAHELLGPMPSKVYTVGVLPHWSDSALTSVYPGEHELSPIVNSNGIRSMVLEIAQCETLITSSLHGLIVADALGIPVQAEAYGRLRRPKEGGDFKWRDYAASLGIEHRWGKRRVAPCDTVRRLQGELMEVFDGLRG